MKEQVFNKIVDHVFANQDRFQDENGVTYGDLFDYPDYGGLPKSICHTLTSEAIDAMQTVLQQDFSTKKAFSQAYKKELLALGETIKKDSLNFDPKDFDDLFCYATSIRESTIQFCAREISAKEWLKTAYKKQTKTVISQMLKKYGVDKTRNKMRKFCDKFYWMGDWRQ